MGFIFFIVEKLSEREHDEEMQPDTCAIHSRNSSIQGQVVVMDCCMLQMKLSI